ncbi:murein biosynthesis integral membrane protein MurJ [Pseudohalocynthiibacter aestuariivivens]|uniref:Probable lipid II flippase MurJ n=1 Tax=Roseovarius pelagicus TaxID=2980108 RepID=A0ABY6DG74_9RHOB|nr:MULTISPECIES: murein biosynthesis integral membrane protein MurJ [Rhodobacterales]QIE46433.1 murein biosynthesis integral membrane protein MurJ [Pseudohalocynthiibacter aestuariivivens]UXX85045.1 murein biosynthesis integral membrane protein MurJ [Roseovarius pelagicus]
MKPPRLLSGVLTVGVWTLLSRVLGFVRDVLIAGFLGPGPLMDAFVAAFRLPNMFRRFFAEGAFNAAFVPMFSKRLEAQENADGFASLAMSGLALVLLALVGLAMVFMPALVWATAEGFAGDERFDLTVEFGRVVFPYILFISLAALLSGVLNATGRFTAAAAAPVILNVMLCTAMGYAVVTGGQVVQALVWTIPFAGVAQLALVWAAAHRAGRTVRPVRPRWTPEMAQLVRIAIPAALAGGVMQVNLLVGQQVASNYENAVSWLYAADRLYQLPLGVVGIAVGIVLLPDLSRRLRAQDDNGAREALSRAGEISLALTIPAAVALMVIPIPLITVLFERGAFGTDDTAATALAVAIYGLGLPAFVLQKVLQPIYFAREDTKRPFHYAVVAMVVNAAIAIGLAPFIGWIAAAIGTTLAGWAMVWLLLRGTRPFGDVARFDVRFRRRIWRIALAATLMGVVLWHGMLAIGPLFGLDGWRWLALAVLVLLGGLSYGLFGRLLGAFDKGALRKAFRRG